MASRITVGELVAAFLERCGVRTAFGVISIHNMPVLDAFARRAKVRFVPARSEPGALNMADAYARVLGGLGVAVTSTGTAAGNAAGAMVEALTAGTPLLHITGQVESPYVERDVGYIHGAPKQLAMLRAVSKAALRVRDAHSALVTLQGAVSVALTPPTGPVSVEIPIDVQKAMLDAPEDIEPPLVISPQPSPQALDALAERLALARRPMLWLGGGARHARDAALRLAGLGFGIVSSVQGRGIVPEDHPASLGAFHLHAPVEKFYSTCDALLVAGSRLRSNETLGYRLKLPCPLYRIDADPAAANGIYAAEQFVQGDSAVVLAGLAERLEGRLRVELSFATDLAAARAAAERALRDSLGPYAQLADELARVAGDEFLWVRDVTIANSTWGNRLPRLRGPRDGVHALGGGIGQGIQMGIGAALAEQARGGARKTFVLAGDGGLQVNLGELATAVQERADLAIVVMNDRGYGVIRNIQDAEYGGRRCYVDLHTPALEPLAQAMGMAYRRVARAAEFGGALDAACATRGPALIEVDMQAVGPYAAVFAGPPVRKEATQPEGAANT